MKKTISYLGKLTPGEIFILFLIMLRKNHVTPLDIQVKTIILLITEMRLELFQISLLMYKKENMRCLF